MLQASERVRRMKQDFISLHEQGYSIPEIAKIHKLAWGTVYRHLQEIADENGVAREELLKVIRVRKNERCFVGNESHAHVNIEALEKGFNDAVQEVDGVISMIENILKTAKEADINVDGNAS